MHDLVIVGTIINEKGRIHGSIAIDDGKIRGISTGVFKGEDIITLKRGQVVLPGLVDVHTHLRDFEEKSKESVETGTMAAIHGGITTIFDMPNTRPPVVDVNIFHRREDLFSRRAYSNYALGFLLSGNCPEAQRANADFYKVFMGASTGGIFSKDFEGDYTCSPGITSVHAEDAELIRRYPQRPPAVEVNAIKKALRAAEKLRKPINICHVSTAGGMREILRAGLPWVSFEVTPHHLFLTRKDYERNPLLKVYPPLREEGDRTFLWRNFVKIPLIASDHAPHTLEDKENGAAGIPGLETEVALLLDAFNRGLISLEDIVEKMHTNPIRTFAIKNKGLRKGMDADLTVVDIKREWRVKPEEFYTKSKWSPWEGKILKGKVIMTVLRGNVVMEGDEIIGKPQGARINVGGNHT